MAEREGLLGALRLALRVVTCGDALASLRAASQTIVVDSSSSNPDTSGPDMRMGLPGPLLILAEREGFEPSRGFHPCRFSRPVQSTTLPPLRGWALSGKGGGLATGGGPCGLAATRGRDRFGPAVLTLRALPGGNVLRRLRRFVEPSRGFHPCRFSRPVQSTTLPPLRGWALSGKGDGLATGGGAGSPGEGVDVSGIFGMQRLTFARLNPNLVRAPGG